MKHLLFFLAFFLLVSFAKSQTRIPNPRHGMSSARGLRMDTLQVNDKATVISFHNTGRPGLWISVPEKTYILPVGAKDTLFAIGTQNIPFNQKFTIPESGFIDFKVIFPALPKGVTHFDYGEANASGSWFIYDIPTKMIPSTMPAVLAGNWYNKETGDWVLGLTDEIVIYKNMAWSYVIGAFKRNKGIIRLKHKNQQIELAVKVNKDGDLMVGESKEETMALARTVNKTEPSDQIFTEPLFNVDTAIYAGYVEGYCDRAGFKTISLAVNDILTGEQNSIVTNIEPDGEFSFKVPLYYPHHVFVRSKIYNGSIFLEPGETLFQYVTPYANKTKIYYMGHSARINADLQKLQNLRGPDYSKLNDTVLDLSQEQYKSYLLKGLDKDLATLDELKAKKGIGSRAYQVKKLDLTYSYHSKIMEYKWDYESAYRKKNNIPRTQRIVDITYEPVPDDYYNFITPELVNNPVALLSTNFGTFFNRLKYAEFLSPASYSLTTKNLMDELKKMGYPFTTEEKLLADLLERSEQLNAEMDNSDYSKTYKDQEKTFQEKYKIQIMQINRKARDKGVTIEDLKQAMLDEGIELSHEDVALLDAREAFQKTDLGKKIAEVQKTLGPYATKFHNDHRDVMNEYFASMRINSRNEKLKTVCGIDGGLGVDIMNSQEISGKIVTNLSPLDDKKLLLYQATFTTPFVGQYLDLCNEATKAKIEANKFKGGYTLNEVPKTDADKVFDAIMKKYKGKLVYVDFWATWCAPCRSGIERIKPLKDETTDWDVAFVYITNQSSPETIYNNMIPDIKGEHYRLSDDDWNYLKGKFNISGIPHYVLVGKDGRVINPKLGHRSNEELKTLFKKELKL